MNSDEQIPKELKRAALIRRVIAGQLAKSQIESELLREVWQEICSRLYQHSLPEIQPEQAPEMLADVLKDFPHLVNVHSWMEVPKAHQPEWLIGEIQSSLSSALDDG